MDDAVPEPRTFGDVLKALSEDYADYLAFLLPKIAGSESARIRFRMSREMTLAPDEIVTVSWLSQLCEDLEWAIRKAEDRARKPIRFRTPERVPFEDTIDEPGPPTRPEPYTDTLLETFALLDPRLSSNLPSIKGFLEEIRMVLQYVLDADARQTA